MKTFSLLVLQVQLTVSLSQNSHFDEGLSHWNWSHSVFYHSPKLWMSYNTKRLEMVCLDVLRKAKFLRSYLWHLQKSLIFQGAPNSPLTNTWKKTCYTYFCMIFSKSKVKSPLGNLHIFSPEIIFPSLHSFSKDRVVLIVWMFHLHAKLRVRCYFQETDIQMVYNNCSRGNVTIVEQGASDQALIAVFCGNHAPFTIYSLGRKIDMQLRYFHTLVCKLKLFFMVQDVDQLATVLQYFLPCNLCQILQICTKSQTLYTYHLYTHKHRHVCVSLKHLNLHSVVLLDGPGYESETLKHNFYGVVCFSTFQGLIQVVNHATDRIQFFSYHAQSVTHKLCHSTQRPEAR